MGLSETEKAASTETKWPASGSVAGGYLKTQVALRVLLFAATLTSVIVITTGKQTVMVPVPGTTLLVPASAKFSYSPALIYFVAAFWTACAYSISTTIASIQFISKPSCSTKFFLYVGLMDVVMLGIVASASGAIGAVGYIALKGNKHTRWNKVCNVFDKFCDHVASSFGVSLVASLLLVFLSCLSIISLYKKIR